MKNQQVTYGNDVKGKFALPSERLSRNLMRDLGSPAYHFDGELLSLTAQEQGGYAVMVPVRRSGFQLPISTPMFFGITSDLNTNETHHYHPHQLEVYAVIRGVARMQTWLGLQHREFILKAGDVLVVPAGTCHYLSWIEPGGTAYVFRSHNFLTGDAAKVQCDESMHRQLEEAPFLKVA